MLLFAVVHVLRNLRGDVHGLQLPDLFSQLEVFSLAVLELPGYLGSSGSNLVELGLRHGRGVERG